MIFVKQMSKSLNLVLTKYVVYALWICRAALTSVG